MVGDGGQRVPRVEEKKGGTGVESANLFGAVLWSNAELAEVFGISPQRLGVLCKEGVLPLPTDGLHEPKAVVAKYVQHLKQREAGRSQAGEQVRKMQLDNELRAIKLQRMAGELVPVARVQKEWFESTRRVRDGLLNLPSRLSGVFAAEATQEKIFELFSEEIHAVLTELSSRHMGLSETAGPHSADLFDESMQAHPCAADQRETTTARATDGEEQNTVPQAESATDRATGEESANRFSTGD